MFTVSECAFIVSVTVRIRNNQRFIVDVDGALPAFAKNYMIVQVILMHKYAYSFGTYSFFLVCFLFF